MGALPKRKSSSYRKGRRRQQITLKAKSYQLCPNCQQPTLPHQACKHCGTYKAATA